MSDETKEADDEVVAKAARDARIREVLLEAMKDPGDEMRQHALGFMEDGVPGVLGHQIDLAANLFLEALTKMRGLGCSDPLSTLLGIVRILPRVEMACTLSGWGEGARDAAVAVMHASGVVDCEEVIATEPASDVPELITPDRKIVLLRS